MGSHSIFIVAGARPNFMKVAPIFHALNARRASILSIGVDVQLSIIHTGQHYDENMSEIFFRELNIPKPDRHLGVGSGSHAEQTAKIMVSFEKVILESMPDKVIVVGDVNSTVACSLTAKKLGISVAHIEAGLRSFDMGMPEEINRKLTDAISDDLFVTEESGLKNLHAEGISEEKIHFVGNVMIDTLKRNLAKIESGEFTPSNEIRSFCEKEKRYAVLTLHRPSNVDTIDSIKPIWTAISELARKIPVFFPVHPRTRSRIAAYDFPNEKGISMVDPLGYLDMLCVVKNATVVLTDSGGLQEETTSLGIPCITIRNTTERPVTVEIGTNYLTGTKTEKILATAGEILSGNGKRGAIPPLWDGHASERIAEILLPLKVDYYNSQMAFSSILGHSFFYD